MKNKVLVTGGAGFLGTHLVKYLLEQGDSQITIFDKLEKHTIEDYGKSVTYFKGNILTKSDVQKVFEQQGPFKIVYHLASAMPNKQVSDQVMWDTNVDGTENIVKEAVKNNVESFIFTSSNVTYGIPKNLPVTEDTPLNPLEIYGRSKAKVEQNLEKYKNDINIQIFRCPVITGIGRLGLQAILYEFISENKKVYVLGSGLNKYQFVDADDVASALYKATKIKGYDIYTIGADNILTLKDLYKHVITFAKSKSKVVCLPNGPALLALAILEKLNLSPLGVYQYNMMGRSIYADTTKIKKKLGWKPKMTNADTFIENYKWYIKNKDTFTGIDSGNMSANRSLPKMKAFQLLKLLS